jgi:peroxiredoxin
MQVDARLKSMFVMPAVTVSAVLAVWSAVEAITRNYDAFAWWGAAIAALPLPLFMAILLSGKLARSSENLPLFLLVSAIGLVISGWEVFIEGVSRPMPFVVACIATVILHLYVYWYSRFGRIDSAKLAVGSKLPEFELRGASGDMFSSAELKGSPAVIVFYRGNWCPFCMAQISELSDHYSEFADMGVTIVLISPQSAEQNRILAEKFDVPIRFLVDEGSSLAMELGIAVLNGVPLGLPGKFDSVTVMPTVVAANASGTIVYSDQPDNYRVRPEPAVYLSILRRSGSID